MDGYADDVLLDTTDEVNGDIGFGPNDKYSPQYPDSNLNMESINSRADAPRRKS